MDAADANRSPLAARPLERRVGPGLERAAGGSARTEKREVNQASEQERLHLAMRPLCREPKTACNEGSDANPDAVNKGTARAPCNLAVTEMEQRPAR